MFYGQFFCDLRFHWYLTSYNTQRVTYDSSAEQFLISHWLNVERGHLTILKLWQMNYTKLLRILKLTCTHYILHFCICDDVTVCVPLKRNLQFIFILGNFGFWEYHINFFTFFTVSYCLIEMLVLCKCSCVIFPTINQNFAKNVPLSYVS